MTCDMFCHPEYEIKDLKQSLLIEIEHPAPKTWNQNIRGRLWQSKRKARPQLPGIFGIGLVWDVSTGWLTAWALPSLCSRISIQPLRPYKKVDYPISMSFFGASRGKLAGKTENAGNAMQMCPEIETGRRDGSQAETSPRLAWGKHFRWRRPP
ncbi:hypothetical protein Ddc_08503 [Ditylenchus destructor]|nr:hypothetical protein Ddc_08503 [Ditylenchus destructor]